jgi:PadR family transcriptional regulator PadR
VVHAQLLLLMGERPRHGYELVEALRALGFETSSPSTIYRDLARLEEQGLVASFWETTQARGPARHMYELTPAGWDDLDDCATDVRLLASLVADFLRRHADASPPPPAPRPGRRRGGATLARLRRGR